MDIPLYVTASVLVVAAFAVLAVPTALARASRRAEQQPKVALPVGIVLGLWIVATMILAASGAYRPADGEVVPAIGVALMVTFVGVGLAVAFFPDLRTVLAHPSTQSDLVAVQVWRIEGLAFLVLMAQGTLPPLFAVPAGLGDLTVGLTAPFMARNLRRRGLAIVWNLLGLADLALAVGLGATASPGAAQVFVTTPTAEAMTSFPMAIVPTFLVPLSIALHLVSLRYLLSAGGRTETAPRLTPV